MIRNTVALLVLGVLLQLSGCSSINLPDWGSSGFDVHLTHANLDASPVKSPVVYGVHTVVVADISSVLEADHPEHHKRMYRAIVHELEHMLRKTRRYRVIGADQFAAELEATGLEFDPINGDREKARHLLAGIGRKLGAHAVAYIGLEDINSASFLFHRMRAAEEDNYLLHVASSVELIRAFNSELVWSQRSNAIWEADASDLERTENRVIRAKMRAVLSPMVEQLMRLAS